VKWDLPYGVWKLLHREPISLGLNEPNKPNKPNEHTMVCYSDEAV